MHAKIGVVETAITAGPGAGLLSNLSTTIEAEGAGNEMAGAKLTSVRASGYFAPTTLAPGYYRPTLWVLPSSIDQADFDAIIRTYNPWYDRTILSSGESHLVGAAALEADRVHFSIRTRGTRVMRDFGLALFLYQEASGTNMVSALEITVRWEHA